MPPRDHRARQTSPFLSLDGFLRLHLSLLKTRLRLAIATLDQDYPEGIGFRDVEPSDDGKRRRAEPRKLERGAALLAQREKELRADLVVAWQESRGSDQLDPIHHLKTIFRLADAEAELWMLALARHVDPSFGPLFARLGCPHGQAAPILVLTLLPDCRPSELHELAREDGRLFRFALLEAGHTTDPSPLLTPLRLARGFDRHLLDATPPLPTGVRLYTAAPDDPHLLTTAGLSGLNRFRTIVAEQIHATRPTAIGLRSDPVNRPHLWAYTIAHQQGRQLMVVDLHTLLTSHEAADRDVLAILRSLGREARMSDRATLLIDLGATLDLDRVDRERLAFGLDELARQNSPLFLSLDRHDPDLEVAFGIAEIPFALPAIDPPTLREIWLRAVPADVQVATDAGLDWLIARPDISDDQRDLLLDRAALLAQRRRAPAVIQRDDLVETLRTLHNPALHALADRLGRGFEALQHDLAASTAAAVEGLRAAGRARHGVARSLGRRAGERTGVAAAFVGPTGTGKTAAAQLLALDGGLDPVDAHLSELVCDAPWQTIQRVEAMFAPLGTRHLLLLHTHGLDLSTPVVAHALAQALHRAERTDALVILESTVPLADPHAAMVDFTVTFAVPEVLRRLAIWEAAFPQRDLLTEGLHLDMLAQEFEMGGPLIRRAARKAALVAATRPAADNRVTFNDLWEAARASYRWMGREAPPLDQLR